MPPLHACFGQGAHHACVHKRKVGSFKRAPAALLHGRRGAAGHHMQTPGVIGVEQIVIGEFAGDKGYGEGDCFAIGRPAAIMVELAWLGRLLLVVHRAVAAQKELLVPGGAHIARVRGQPHAQAKAAIRRAQAAQYVAHLFFGVQRRLIEADEGIARTQVLPHIVVRLHVGETDGRSGGKAPGPFGRTHEDAAQGGVEPAGLVDDVGHLDKGGAEDDGPQVGVFMLLHRVHQHGFGLEGAGGAAEEQDVRFWNQARLFARRWPASSEIWFHQQVPSY